MRKSIFIIGHSDRVSNKKCPSILIGILKFNDNSDKPVSRV